MTFRMDSQHVSSEKNSWYLKLGYVHHFLCKCGQEDQYRDDIILMNLYHPDHSCSHCANTHYLDSVMFLTNPKVVRWSKFNWNIETMKTDESWIVRAYSSIPLFDYDLQKIRFRKTVIATNTMFFSGINKYHEDYPMILKKYVYNQQDKATPIKELIDEELKKVLYKFILESPIYSISWIENERLDKLSLEEQIKLLSFFLENDHLNEYDFFYWDNFLILRDMSEKYPSVQEMLSFVLNHREEKSIKKAYFDSYERSMETYSRYNNMADYIFSRHIEDRNFLLELIKMDIEVKHVLFDEVSMITSEYFLEFLRERYTQKAVTKLFTALNQGSVTSNTIIRDTIWMCRGETMNFIREHFRKVPLNFHRLHDEFIRINTIRKVSLHGKSEFEYEENDLHAQGKKDLFEYRLPETIHLLQKWSHQLHNCMYGYSGSIHEGLTIIYGVFKGDILTYAIEIRGNKIVQALGKNNSHISVEDRAEIDKWFKEVYIPAWMRSPVKGAKRGENYERV